MDINSNIIKKEFNGLESRCIQHEIDHLKGVIYTDIMIPNAELMEAAFFSDYNTEV